MRAKYIILNIIFLAPLAVLLALRWRQTDTKHFLKVLGILTLLTAIFDNLMILAGIMAYSPAAISGIKIGLAPIEDFAYSLAAVLLVALFWDRAKENKK